jgi:hypothetical protein
VSGAITVAEFAGQMRLLRQADARSVLLIGYDGGSALINHSRPERMLADMRSDHNPTAQESLENIERSQENIERSQENIERYWSLLGGSATRIVFMQDHTKPSDAAGPDVLAMGHIAQLLRDNYLFAVVATDVSQVLYEHLRTQVDLSRIDLVGDRAQKVDEVIRASSKNKIFVDAGEVLLYGCTPGRYDVNKGLMQESANQLKDFIASFHEVFCWGWCNLNMSLGSLFKPNRDRKIHVLGEYSACLANRPDNGTRIVVNSGEPVRAATTQILVEIASRLGLKRPDAFPKVSPTALPGSPSVPIGEDAGRRLRPLLTAEVLERMRDRVMAYPISIIGVESARVREDTALWLLDELRRRGPADYRSESDLAGLARRVAVRVGAPGRTMVGRLSDDISVRGLVPSGARALGRAVKGKMCGEGRRRVRQATGRVSQARRSSRRSMSARQTAASGDAGPTTAMRRRNATRCRSRVEGSGQSYRLFPTLWTNRDGSSWRVGANIMSSGYRRCRRTGSASRRRAASAINAHNGPRRCPLRR